MEQPETYASAVSMGSGDAAASPNLLFFPQVYHDRFMEGNGMGTFLRKTNRKGGKPALFLTEAETLELANPLRFTLIGKFTYGHPKLELIRNHFEMLKLAGNWNVGQLDGRHIMIKLSKEEDYALLFTKKMYQIEKCPVKFLKWTPEFDYNAEPPIATIWIRLPGLKLHLYNKQILFSLAAIFGKPLKLDLPTFNLSRPSAARILVEMDITATHAEEVWIGTQSNGYWQPVIIEQKPYYCKKCRMFSHTYEKCFVAHPHLKQSRTYIPEHENNIQMEKTAVQENEILQRPENDLQDQNGNRNLRPMEDNMTGVENYAKTAYENTQLVEETLAMPEQLMPLEDAREGTEHQSATPQQQAPSTTRNQPSRHNTHRRKVGKVSAPSGAQAQVVPKLPGA